MRTGQGRRTMAARSQWSDHRANETYGRMDEQRIDRLAKELAGAPQSRRRAVRAGLAAMAGLVSWLTGAKLVTEATHHHAGRRRRHRNRGNGNGRPNHGRQPPQDCTPLQSCTVIGLNDIIGPLPGAPIAMCWRWRDLSCEPCNGTKRSVYAETCDQTYSACANACEATEL
jgi:hypothetical protein